METDAGNKIIQTFMRQERIIGYPGCDHSIHYDKDLKKLMEAVEKICRTVVGDDVKYIKYSSLRTFGMINEENGNMMVRFNGHQLFEAPTLIKATWLAVVDWITWYNTNKLFQLKP